MNRDDDPDFDGVSVDTRTIPQDCLNIVTKERSNLFPWKGQFSPQLIEVLLQSYASPGSFVLDPFLGSGTVLHEAGRLGHPAFGAEVNPAAFKMAQIYRFLNIQPHRRSRAIAEAMEIIHHALPETMSVFSPLSGASDQPFQTEIAEQSHHDDSLCRTLLEALVVLLNFGEKELTEESVLSVWKKLRNRVMSLPFVDRPVELANCDARSLPFADCKADIVITSPPYINVFNYHQQYRQSVEALGWNLLEVAKSEIGSNRKHRGNRFLTVIQYCLDMAAVLGELRRVCHPAARIIIVVGRESNVRKTKFFNGEIVAKLAVRSAGYRLEARQERVFQNRFGEMIYEDILHLSVVGNDALSTPAEVAKEALTAALGRAPAESLSDLNSALEKIAEVRPSPLYNGEIALPQQQVLKKREVV